MISRYSTVNYCRSCLAPLCLTPLSTTQKSRLAGGTFFQSGVLVAVATKTGGLNTLPIPLKRRLPPLRV